MKKYYDNCDFDIREEMIKRVKRLYPPYIAVILVAAVFALLLKKIPYDIMFHLFSVQNIQWMITAYQSPMQPMTAHTWTLSIEVWVALILFLVMKYVHKENKKSFMYLFVVIGILYRMIAILAGCNPFVVSLCPLAHFDAFGCGALLAISLHENRLQTKKAFLSGRVEIIGIIICIIVMAQKDHLTFIEGYKNLALSKNYLGDISPEIFIFLLQF